MENFESLDEEQNTEEPVASGIDRRNFVKLAIAAAATSGMTLKAAAQQARGGQTPAPPPIPLGQGEPPAWAFPSVDDLSTGAMIWAASAPRPRSSAAPARTSTACCNDVGMCVGSIRQGRAIQTALNR
jgi:hypothetical protein